MKHVVPRAAAYFDLGTSGVTQPLRLSLRVQRLASRRVHGTPHRLHFSRPICQTHRRMLPLQPGVQKENPVHWKVENERGLKCVVLLRYPMRCLVGQL
jgi:hypothetical protein